MISALLFEILVATLIDLLSLNTLAKMLSHRNVLPIQLDILPSIGLRVFVQVLFVVHVLVRSSCQSAFRPNFTGVLQRSTQPVRAFSGEILCADLNPRFSRGCGCGCGCGCGYGCGCAEHDCLCHCHAVVYLGNALSVFCVVLRMSG